MAEWLYESGIGEARAALIDDGRMVEAAIEREHSGIKAGAVIEATLTRIADASGRASVALSDGISAHLVGPLGGLTEGSRLRVVIEREALPEGGTIKPARARVTDLPIAPGPDLLARITASGVSVRHLGHGEDLLEAHGWSDMLEQAASGIVAAPDALLRIVVTPAMTLIDIDGGGPAAALAVAGAGAAARAIRLFDLAGSIGIDLPTVPARADRLAAAAALDAVLPPPFERTAVNGFGFLQIIRRRVRPSLIETLLTDPLLAAALALLRRAERTAGHGPLTLVAAPPVIAVIAARPDWCDRLARRMGATIGLQGEPGLPTSAGHVVRSPA